MGKVVHLGIEVRHSEHTATIITDIDQPVPLDQELTNEETVAF